MSHHELVGDVNMLNGLEAAGYAVRCANGRREADQLITEMVQTKNPLILKARIQHIAAAGSISADDVGLIQTIAERLMQSQGD
jgi:hypothetical protein